MIIHDINMTRTFAVQFLCKSRRRWCTREQTRLGGTSIDLVFIKKSKEDEVVEQHFVEAQTTQKDTGEENVIEMEIQPSTKV
jgi:hypothetical protein